MRYARALRAAGKRGLHTHEIRRQGISGNPAQRAAELRERGFGVKVTREHRGGRSGARHVMLYDAGDKAAFLTDSELVVQKVEREREAEPDTGGQLFDLPHQARSAASEDWDAAA